MFRLSAPAQSLFSTSCKAEGSLFRSQIHKAVIKLDPVWLIRVLRSINKGKVVAAVVGLPTMHSHTEEDIVFILASRSALQEAKMNCGWIFKISQYFDKTISVFSILVTLEIEKDDFR